MRTTKLFHTLAFIVLSTVLGLAAPQLTVVVVVGGLDQSSLEMMRPYWPTGGLRTLSEEAYQTTIHYPQWIYGGAETTATLMTGVTPDIHGYTMDQYFSREDRDTHALLYDAREKGIGTSEHYSARRLLAPTITDEMRMIYGEQAKIYSVGIHPEQAIVMGGHAANACCWLDEKSHRWVGTSYYSGGLPASADRMNVSGRITELGNQIWGPRMEISLYTRPTKEEKKRNFSYVSSQHWLTTPATNTLVIEQALQLVKTEQLGKDGVPDMLLIELTTQTPKACGDRIQSAEQEDMYLWLNKDLGILIQELKREVGAANYQLVLIGRPLLGMNKELLPQAGLNVRQFNIDRAAALISTYLMAIYGHERWIDGGYGNAIYLNRTLIEQKRLPLETIQRQVATLLMDFEGVQMALPALDAMQHPMMQRSINKQSMGDVVFMLEPLWELTNANETIDAVLEDKTESPLMIWSGAIRSWPTEKVDATDVKKLILK